MKSKHLFKKKYGQNFLNNMNLLKIILKEANLKNKNVVEIGAGKGIFTRLIAKEAKKVLTYEIDTSLKIFLEFNNYNNIHIIYDDVLKRNLEKDFYYFFAEEDLNIIGNLPYHIFSSLIFKILFLEKVKTFTFLIQKELGLRILSQEKKGKFSSFLSIFLQSLTKITKIRNVKNTMFFPKPKVDGIVLKFEKLLLKDEEKEFIKKEFYVFLKASFKQKRKQMINNLSCFFSLSKSQIFLFFKKYQIPFNIRAEQISILKFKEISALFFNFFNKQIILKQGLDK
ncbi:ribosomal RNA adenine dimethylase family protein [Candidatus Phytoplasma oryzae]|uniref:16S rRNA methyltransferase n=1 Tax=Candidatus Phytoplasma oryzae TaxID=203274 RepID=A0A139JR25_9MOLU|nr:16S rRNA (adenine(1518)-N(6)/adenine(1519)-N(6))-dimethyltransferase RsmA [Candidatus Phytoplasma oryzae]KXT29398.1 ribosomal RNA adenine dimethylase family protein [Candidatus Phytoplasma oryzae]RAM57981.1 16S rRNA methyltransferase [Candidatus Phytoplasma oryzae]